MDSDLNWVYPKDEEVRSDWGYVSRGSLLLLMLGCITRY